MKPIAKFAGVCTTPFTGAIAAIIFLAILGVMNDSDNATLGLYSVALGIPFGSTIGLISGIVLALLSPHIIRETLVGQLIGSLIAVFVALFLVFGSQAVSILVLTPLPLFMISLGAFFVGGTYYAVAKSFAQKSS